MPHPTAGDGAEPAARAMDGLRRIVRALTTSAREHARADEVTGAQRFILRQLRAAPGLSLGELAERTLARQSAVSEVVARLVASGLVARTVSREDARQAVLALTARGQRVTIRASMTVQEHLVQGLAHLSPDRRLVLAESLEAWIEASGLGDTPLRMLLDEPLAKPKPRVTRRRGAPQPTGDEA